MKKVQMTVGGREALVDADMVSKMKRKADLVAAAGRLQGVMHAVPREAEPIVQAHLQKIMGKIIRLNRSIRQNVQFI